MEASTPIRLEEALPPARSKVNWRRMLRRYPTVIFGGAIYTSLLKEERDNAKAATEIAEHERSVAQSALISEAKAHDAALDSRLRAEKLMEFMLADLGKSLGDIGQLKLLDDVSDEVMSYYAGAEDQQTSVSLSQRAAALSSVASFYLGRGRIVDAENAVRTAISLNSELLDMTDDQPDALGQRARFYLVLSSAQRMRMSTEEAIESMDKALAVLESADRDDPEALWIAATAKYERHTIALFSGDVEGAMKYAREAEVILEDLIRDNGEVADYLQLLGRVFTGIADSLLFSGKTDEAITWYLKCVDLLAELTSEHPENTVMLQVLSVAYSRLGYVEQAQNQNLEKAIEYNGEALAINRALVTIGPSNMTWQADYSVALTLMGISLRENGDVDEALGYLIEGRDVAEILARLDSTNPNPILKLAGNYKYVADIYESKGEFDLASENYRKAVELVDRLKDLNLFEPIATDPAHASSVRDMAASATNLSSISFKQREFEDSLYWAEQAVQVYDTMLNANNSEDKWVSNINLVHAHSQAAIAADALEDSSAIDRHLAAMRSGLNSPANDESQLSSGRLAISKLFRANVHTLASREAERLGNLEDAKAEAMLTLEIANPMVEVNEGLRTLAIEALVRLGRKEEAMPLVESVRGNIMENPTMLDYLQEQGVLDK